MPDEKFELGKDPAFVEMQKLFKGMVTIIQQQGAALTAIRTDLAKGPAKGKTKDDDDDDDDDDKNVDVDKLSNKEFMALLMKNVGGLLDEKVGGVTKKVDGVMQGVRNKDLTEQFEKLSGKHKDFKEWGDEMNALAKENPTLSLKRLYTLAREENPDKTKTLDEKYADKKDDTKDEGLSLFGGFRPTTKTSGADGKDGKKDKVTIDQALDKAWEEAVAKVPALGKMEDALD